MTERFDLEVSDGVDVTSTMALVALADSWRARAALRARWESRAAWERRELR